MENSTNSTDEISMRETHGEFKLLGLYCNALTDEFYFDFKDVIALKTIAPTKCSVLSVSTKVFNPLGLPSPFTILTKVLF